MKLQRVINKIAIEKYPKEQKRDFTFLREKDPYKIQREVFVKNVTYFLERFKLEQQKWTNIRLIVFLIAQAVFIFFYLR
jgi:hypothetical protein